MIMKFGQFEGKRYGKTISALFSNTTIDGSLFFFTLVGFFYGRAIFFHSQNPFIVALTGAAMLQGIHVPIVSVMTLAGLLTLGDMHLFAQYAVTEGVFLLINVAINKFRRPTRTRVIITSILSSFIIGYFFVYRKDFLIFDLVLVFIEAMLTGGFVFIFSIAISFLKKRSRRMVISSEELVAVTIFTAFCLLGANVEFFSLSLCNIFSILIMLLLSYYGGVGSASAAALLLGFVECVSGLISPSLIAVYAISALISTMLKNWGRVVCLLGFLSANLLLNLYLNGSSIEMNLGETLIACGIFFLLPKRATGQVEKYLAACAGQPVKNASYEDRLKQFAVKRLNRTAAIYKDLSSEAKTLSSVNPEVTRDMVDRIIEITMEEQCGDCEKQGDCWRKHARNTYLLFQKALSTIEQEYNRVGHGLPNLFENRCKRPRTVYMTLKHQYELMRAEIACACMAAENRDTAWEQIGELSNIIRKLAFRLEHSMDFDQDLERTIVAALDNEGIYVKEVDVVYVANHAEVELVFYDMLVEREQIEKIQAIVNQATGMNFIRPEQSLGKRAGVDQLVLREIKRYRLTVGCAVKCKSGNQILGDSYTYGELNDGKYAMILSDGMGSGEKAAKESKLAVNLLEKLLLADFDRDTAIKSLNSLLILHSEKEEYATIDLAVINENTGDILMEKLGSADSYIKRDDYVEVIRSNALPVGIVKNVELTPYQTRLKDGDMIIMVTDGILDCPDKALVDSEMKENDKELWLVELLKQMRSKNPQIVADNILEEAMKRCSREISDDMTVLVLKIWKTTER